jgi:hypothetical protein
MSDRHWTDPLWIYDEWDYDIFDPEEFNEAFLYGLIPGYTLYNWLTQPGLPSIEQVTAGIYSTALSWAAFYYGHRAGYLKVPFGFGARMSGALGGITGRTAGGWLLRGAQLAGPVAVGATVGYLAGEYVGKPAMKKQEQKFGSYATETGLKLGWRHGMTVV